MSTVRDPDAEKRYFTVMWLWYSLPLRYTSLGWIKQLLDVLGLLGMMTGRAPRYGTAKLKISPLEAEIKIA